MTATATCPQCSTPVPVDAPSGLCPSCLLRAGLWDRSQVTIDPNASDTLVDPEQTHPLRRVAPLEPAGTRFANYELLERIAQGGMGVVYKAHDITLDRVIALKMILAGRFANEAEVQRFRHEAEAAANLDHPNIVPIYEIDEHDGRQYFTMKFIEGGSLATHLQKYRRDPRLAAQLLATVARAVHHGHRRGVLHRDLKPPNILIDENGEPHISDFGVAKRIEEHDHAMTRTGTIIGTPAYMAPEQALGQTKEITVAADVYSLGAILFEILSGRPPFEADSPIELLRKVIEQPPLRPRQIDPSIDRDLETICLKCLEKDRHLRYQSAEALADELARFCRGEPLRARPVGPIGRIWRWSRRNPAMSGGALAAAALIIAIIAFAVSIARQREVQLVEQVGRGNLWSARTAAVSFLWQLERFSRIVETMADDPGIAEHLRAGNLDAARSWLAGVGAKFGNLAGFESWLLQDADGITIDRAPHLPELVGRDFSARDYFIGARRHATDSGAEAVHVSRVFKSEADGFYKFAISAPICISDEGRIRMLGVITATITTASTMGSLQLNDDRRHAVLVGRIDPSGAPDGASSVYRLIVHPAYQSRDEAIAITNPRLGALPRPDPDVPELQIPAGANPVGVTDEFYIDPISARDPRFAGRWLSAFAPVGNTELVVIVQQRYDDVIATDRKLIRNFVLAAGGAIGGGAMFAIAVALYGLRRSRAAC